MAVQTVGIEFNLNAKDGLLKLKQFEDELKKVGIVADRIKFSQIGKNVKLSATIATENLAKLNDQIKTIKKNLDITSPKFTIDSSPIKAMEEATKKATKAAKDQQAETAKLAKAEQARLKETTALKAKAIAEELANYRLVNKRLQETRTREVTRQQELIAYNAKKIKQEQELLKLRTTQVVVQATGALTATPFDRKSKLNSAKETFKELIAEQDKLDAQILAMQKNRVLATSASDKQAYTERVALKQKELAELAQKEQEAKDKQLAAFKTFVNKEKQLISSKVEAKKQEIAEEVKLRKEAADKAQQIQARLSRLTGGLSDTERAALITDAKKSEDLKYRAIQQEKDIQVEKKKTEQAAKEVAKAEEASAKATIKAQADTKQAIIDRLKAYQQSLVSQKAFTNLPLAKQKEVQAQTDLNKLTERYRSLREDIYNKESSFISKQGELKTLLEQETLEREKIKQKLYDQLHILALIETEERKVTAQAIKTEATRPKAQPYTKGLPIPEGSGLSISGKSSSQIKADALKLLADMGLVSEKLYQQRLTTIAKEDALKSKELQAERDRLFHHKKFLEDFAALDSKFRSGEGTQASYINIANLRKQGKLAEATIAESNQKIKELILQKKKEITKIGEDLETTLITPKMANTLALQASQKFEKLISNLRASIKQAQKDIANDITRVGILDKSQSWATNNLSNLNFGRDKAAALALSNKTPEGINARTALEAQNLQRTLRLQLEQIDKDWDAKRIANEQDLLARKKAANISYINDLIALEKAAAAKLKSINDSEQYNKKAFSSVVYKDTARQQAIEKQNSLALATIQHGLNSEKVLREKYANELAQIEARKAAKIASMQALASTPEGAAKLERYLQGIKQGVDKYKALLHELDKAEAARAARASKATLVGNFQQKLLTEQNQHLALLKAGYEREKAVREQGANSIQAKQAIIAEKRLKAEQELQTKLADIQKKTGLAASAGGLTILQATKASKAAIDLHGQTTDALNKEAAALEKTKSAHMNLTSFIGTSMLIWRSYNFVLGQTTSLLRSIPKVGMELDSTISVLKATMGGSAGAAAGLKALDKEATRTGINIVALRENWRTFSASTVVAGETMDTSWKIFSQMNTVITALHYSGDKATHIFMALSQIFNKSKVQSEELVKQLGNLLPAAFAVFAKAQGLSTMQLSQQMKKGLVFAHDTVAKFTAEYEKMFRISFANASKSLNAEVGRMQNEFIKLGEAIYKLTEEDMVAFVKKTGEVVSALTANPEKLDAFIEKLENIGKVLAVIGSSMVITKLVTAIRALAVSPVGLAVSGLIGGGTLMLDAYDDVKVRQKKLAEDAAELLNAIGVKKEDISKPITIDIKINEDPDLVRFQAILATAKDELKKLQNAGVGASVPVRIDGRNYYTTDPSRIAAEEARLKAAIKKGEESIEQYKGELFKKAEQLTTSTLILDERYLKERDKLYLTSIKDRHKREVETARLLFEEQTGDVQAKLNLANGKIAEARKKLIDLKQNTGLSESDKQTGLLQVTEELAKQEEVTVGLYKDLENAKQAFIVRQGELDVQYAKKEDAAAKKREELAKRQVELAKKTAADLKEIADQTAERELQAIDKKLKALEKIQDEKSIGDYHRTEISLIDEKIAALDRQLEALKKINAEQEGFVAKKTTKSGLIANVFETFQRKGLSEKQAQAMTAEVGRENAFNPAIIFGTHTDPYNKASNFGLISFQGDRKTKILAEMRSKGLVDEKGSVPKNQATIDAMVEFIVKEMAATSSGKAFLANKDIGEEQAGELLGKYIGWRINDPKYRSSGIKNRNNFYQQVEALKGKDVGQLSSFEGSTNASGELLKLEKDKQALEEQKLVSLEKQSEQYKQVQKDINNIHAEYKLYTGEVEKGTEELFAEKHAKVIERLNLEIQDLTKSELDRNEALKARNEIEAIGIIQAKELASARAMKSLGKEEKSIDKQLATISQMESLNLIDPISAMMRRSDTKSSSLIPNLEKQLTELQGRDLSLMPEEKRDATIANIDEIKGKLLELSSTANETFTFTANMVGNAFDTTFRGILDGTIKGKDAFKEFGKSILKTMQELVLQALKSQIVGLILKGLGAATGALTGSTAANPNGTFATNGIPYRNSNGNVIQFSKGGIPDIGNKFQTFQMANGAAGSLREQGKYEAIMPLKRTANGELGVIAGGAVASNDQRQYNITVNVAGGADETNSKDIGYQIAIATMEKIADTRIANASRVGNSLNRTTAFSGS